MTAVTLRFEGRLPNTALSPNARRRGKVWDQKKATDGERQVALTDIRRELTDRAVPPLPWELTWTVHYPTLKAPDWDAIPSMLKVWQDILALECNRNDGPSEIQGGTVRVVLRSPDAPLMTLEVRSVR